MQVKNFVGIDVSKNTLDISIVDLQGKQIHYECISNNGKSIKTSLTTIMKLHQLCYSDVLFCMEYTGIYNVPMINWLQKQSAHICMESANQIIKSQGLVRGKNDKVDSLRIALYAFNNRHKIKVWQAPREVIKKISILLSQRNRFIKAKKQLSIAVNEQELFLDKTTIKSIKKHNATPLKALDQAILSIEKDLMEIIQSDPKLMRIYEIVTSVDGVGMVTALNLITTTNEFLSINEAKKYACYSGVAPFEHSSGISVRGRTRVSHMANKKVKTMLHMAALAAIQMKGDIKEFYNRKVNEGKNKMCVINAVRNKIIQRVFACVKQDRLFEKNYHFCLVNP
jgi:transposase